MKAVKAKKQKSSEWQRFENFNGEVITITKLEDSLLHIQAWKKDGQGFVPALKTIYTSSQDVSAAHLGKVVQKVMVDVKQKEEWSTK